MIERLTAPGSFHRAPYCHAARAGDFVFVTGQVAADPQTGEYVLGDIETETRRVMDDLAIVLEYAGLTLDDVAASRACLTSSEAAYETFNRAYAEYMGDALPTRTTIGVTALAAGARVEVDLIAFRG